MIDETKLQYILDKQIELDEKIMGCFIDIYERLGKLERKNNQELDEQ